jgi:hypothetical protein
MPDEPSLGESAVRFGCGSLFGLALGVSIALYFLDLGTAACVVVIAVTAVTCGVLAWRLGDDFWHLLSDWVWVWWWPWTRR